MQPASFFFQANKDVAGTFGGVACAFTRGRIYELPPTAPRGILRDLGPALADGDLVELRSPGSPRPFTARDAIAQAPRGRMELARDAEPGLTPAKRARRVDAA